MELAAVEVLKTIGMVSLQDAGRIGYKYLGMPSAGAMDRLSMMAANYLVGNPLGNVCLEVFLGGLKLKVIEPVCFAIAGADATVTLDGVAVSKNTTHWAEKEQIISISNIKYGACVYLAIQHLETVDYLGCQSYTAQQLGTTNRSLRVTTHSKLFVSSANKPIYKSIFKGLETNLENTITLRYTKGLEYKYFKNASDFDICGFKVLPSSNRRGILIKGVEIMSSKRALVSRGTLRGTIQVPPSGNPIVLTNDGPTHGGYPIIGQVIMADLHKLGQLKPGSNVFFKGVSVENAVEQYAQMIKEIEKKLT